MRLVVTSTFVLNGIGGLAFGWLFWTFGLESAMLAHFFADAINIDIDSPCHHVPGRNRKVSGNHSPGCCYPSHSHFGQAGRC